MKSCRKPEPRRRGTGYGKPALGTEPRSQFMFVRRVDGAMDIRPCMSPADAPGDPFRVLEARTQTPGDQMPHLKENGMQPNRILAALVPTLVLFLPWHAQAFECPKHIADAEATIKKVAEEMKTLAPVMDAMMDKKEMSIVHTLLANARIFLVAAKRSHEKPAGPYDHGHAIAKAISARGYAEATGILHRKFYERMARSNTKRK